MNHLSAILAGFSIVSTMILLCSYVFFLNEMRKTLLAKVSCVFLLLGLAALQLAHYLYYVDGVDVLATRAYCFALMLMPSAFFFFAREVLFFGEANSKIDLFHLLPLVAAAFLPLSWIPALAFSFGSLYTLWIVRLVLKLREQSSRFRFEKFFFGMFALMALCALALGLLLPVIDADLFYIAYGNSISVSVILVVAALLIFPELLNDLAQLTELAYAKSKLLGVDTDTKLVELEKLMTHHKQYENENLNLANVAESLALSSHQLSELINTQFGYSFPRYVREHRVRAAKSLLLSEKKTSVLAISMKIGFRSQSAFYAAFKEVTGESPGNYRQSRS